MSETSDSSRPEFWDVRYASGKTPWDFHGIPATLDSFLNANAPGKVLMPKCGTGYEVRAFFCDGLEVCLYRQRADVENAQRRASSRYARSRRFRYSPSAMAMSTGNDNPIWERAKSRFVHAG